MRFSKRGKDFFIFLTVIGLSTFICSASKPTKPPTGRTSTPINVTIYNREAGPTTEFIGTVEGGGFYIEDLIDLGTNSLRLYAGMERLEPDVTDVDPSLADYAGPVPDIFGRGLGYPTPDEIDSDPEIYLNWGDGRSVGWEYNMKSADFWWYQPGFDGYISQMASHGIEPVLCLRNRDPEGRPAWMANPPQAQPWGLNEWYEYVFATAYWCNVKNNYRVTHWQLLNEPSHMNQGWGGTTDDYLDLVDYTKRALDKVASLAQTRWNLSQPLPVILGCPVDTEGSYYFEPTLKQRYDSFSILDYHDYDRIANGIQNMWFNKNKPLSYPNPPKPMWNSEWGTYKTSYNTLSRALETAGDLCSFNDYWEPRVIGCSIFTMWDWGGFGGLVNVANQGDPYSSRYYTETYYAYRLMIRGLQNKIKLERSLSDTSVDCIASRDFDGMKKYIVVVNKSQSAKSVIADLSSLQLTGEAWVYVYDSKHKDVLTKIIPFSDGKVTFPLPKQSAVSVVIHR